ncbi:MAG: hypothetical protein RBU45_26090 [Myxococcota bacterium]|jgi:hypothetical protein|nr:hypothetical protein [Myxococcota bacterium]
MSDDDRPLFHSPEEIVRCWARGIPSGSKALPLEPEGGSGSLYARQWRLFERSERYAVACAVIRRAQLSAEQEAIMLALYGHDLSWDQAARAAGIDDATILADSVKHRVYRARQRALDAIWWAM